MSSLSRLPPNKNPNLLRSLSSIFSSPPSSSPSQLSSPPPEAAAPSSRPSMKSVLKEIFDENDLQTLVQKFKSSSNSYRFRCKHRVYSVTVRRLASVNLHHYIAEILNHQKQFPDIASEGFAVRLISLYGQSGMFEHARDLFDELPHLKCPRTVKSFNAILTAALDSKLFDKVAELFDVLPPEISVKPDVFSYSILIQSLCELGSVDSAVLVLESMKLNGVRPNLITFNVLLNGLYTGGRFLDAEKIWMKMKENNCVPDIISYNERLRGLVLDGKREEAFELFGELESRGLKPNISTFNSLIRGYCDDGNLEEVRRVFSELAKNDCAPNRTTFEILIPFVCGKGDLALAGKLCKDCINSRCFIDVGVLQGVVDALVRESRARDAEILVKFGASRGYRLMSGLKSPSGIE